MTDCFGVLHNLHRVFIHRIVKVASSNKFFSNRRLPYMFINMVSTHSRCEMKLFHVVYRSTCSAQASYRFFFFFQNQARKLGVRLIYECGLYTSFYGKETFCQGLIVLCIFNGSNVNTIVGNVGSDQVMSLCFAGPPPPSYISTTELHPAVQACSERARVAFLECNHPRSRHVGFEMGGDWEEAKISFRHWW